MGYRPDHTNNVDFSLEGEMGQSLGLELDTDPPPSPQLHASAMGGYWYMYIAHVCSFPFTSLQHTMDIN